MDTIILTIISVLALVFSLVVHECAHGLAAEYFGDPTARRQGRLTLNPIPHIDPIGSLLVPFVMSLFGGIVLGWARPVPVNGRNLRNPRDQFPLVSAAGPASNLLLALACALLLGLVVGVAGIESTMGGGRSAGSFLFILLQRAVYLNVLLALFNLVPLPPLDGSWILARFLNPEARAWMERIRPYGFFILIGLIYLGLGRYLGQVVQTVSVGYFRVAESIANLLL